MTSTHENIYEIVIREAAETKAGLELKGSELRAERHQRFIEGCEVADEQMDGRRGKKGSNQYTAKSGGKRSDSKRKRPTYAESNPTPEEFKAFSAARMDKLGGGIRRVASVK